MPGQEQEPPISESTSLKPDESFIIPAPLIKIEPSLESILFTKSRRGRRRFGRRRFI